MKKMQVLLILLTTSFCILCASDKLKKAESSPEREVILSRLDQAKQRLQESVAFYSWSSFWNVETVECHTRYHTEVAWIALNAGSAMTNQEKLNYLYGERRWNLRKKIIKDMIEDEKVDPKSIVYLYDRRPLYESVLYADFAFAAYLLEKGALDVKTTPKMIKFLKLEKSAEEYEQQKQSLLDSVD